MRRPALYAIQYRSFNEVQSMKGLGKIELRDEFSTAEMTSAEFNYLKAHPSECPEHMKKIFQETLAWEKRSNSAKQAVVTKRQKYSKWPSR